MLPRLLSLLACPDCGGNFNCEAFTSDGARVLEGKLVCACGSTYPVIGGIPRILSGKLLADSLSTYHGAFLEKYQAHFPINLSVDALTKRKLSTMHAFGYQWTTFKENFDYFEEIFLGFVRPYLTANDFKGKLVLECGCGSGRPACVAASFGAEVVAFDLSQAVETAHQMTGQFPNLHVVQADIYHPPFKPEFDLVYSVGVIQHLPDPGKALAAIAKLIPPGKALVIWVYGIRELWYQPVELLRKLTTRMAFRPLRVLSYVLAVLSQVFLLTPYKLLQNFPWAAKFAERIPGRIYARFPFGENVLGWFDRLAAPVTHYFSEKDVRDMLSNAGLQNISIFRRPDASASWVARAEAPPPHDQVG